VIHSDLRPENYLLHQNSTGSLDVYLCDFGGSTCGDIDGGHLPDSGFSDPTDPWVSTPVTDIFSLGSVFYTIMTGHWPYKSPGPFKTVEEKRNYEERVDGFFRRRVWPNVEGLTGGNIMIGCWRKEYNTVEAILRAQKAELLIPDYISDEITGLFL